MQLTHELKEWQEQKGSPFSFYTEASIDLADRPELMSAMVEANFMYVFIGIETPSSEALKGSRKFQNLRKDNVQQIRLIQESGLWVLEGFIVGFDSDDESIFARQLEFITGPGCLGHGRCLAGPAHHGTVRPDEARGTADRGQPVDDQLQPARNSAPRCPCSRCCAGWPDC